MGIRVIELVNFRKFKLAKFEFAGFKNPSIDGMNSLGKSTIETAISWILTGKVLSDDYSDGGNDIDSIVNKDIAKGENTEVSIFTDSGKKYTKIYKLGYDTKTGEVNKHTTECKINDVACKNQGTFDSEIQEEFGYQAFFIKLAQKEKFNELQLFTDPLYALKKLDYKVLREMIINLGADVTDEDVYKSNSKFDILRKYESIYSSDFFKAETDYHSKVLEIKADIDASERLLANFNDVEEFDEEYLKTLNEHKNHLLERKATLTAGDSTEEVIRLEAELNQLRTEMKADYDKRKLQLNSELNEIKAAYANELKLIQVLKENASKNEKTIVDSISKSIENVKHTISMYQDEADRYQNKFNDIVIKGKENNAKRNDYLTKLAAIDQRQFNGFVTCPQCGCQFPSDEEAHKHWIKQNETDKETYTNEIKNCEDLRNSLVLECTDYSDKAKKANDEIKKLTEELNKYNDDLVKAKEGYDLAESADVDTTKLDDLKHKQEQKTYDILNCHEDPAMLANISKLEFQIQSIKNNSQEANMTKLQPIENDLAKLEDEITQAYNDKSKWANKLEYTDKYNSLIKKLNDTEFMYQTIREFNNTYISMLNDKATKLFGFEFTMLEQQLNGTPKKVCYLKVDGVDIHNVNTSEATLVGIKFIEKIKNILKDIFNIEKNTLPILVDRAEQFDTVDKLKNLDLSGQLISTRVSEDKEIVIR